MDNLISIYRRYIPKQAKARIRKEFETQYYNTN